MGRLLLHLYNNFKAITNPVIRNRFRLRMFNATFKLKVSKIFQLHCGGQLDLDGFMIFNATFNNISVISWLSVLLVEETGVPRHERDSNSQL